MREVYKILIPNYFFFLYVLLRIRNDFEDVMHERRERKNRIFTILDQSENKMSPIKINLMLFKQVKIFYTFLGYFRTTRGLSQNDHKINSK